MVATVKVKKVSSNVTDPVGDLLTRIRNANIAYKDETLAPVSKQARSILAILQEEGYIHGFDQEGEGVHQGIRITLKYSKSRQRAISASAWSSGTKTSTWMGIKGLG
jgi:ribosomal protein S8